MYLLISRTRHYPVTLSETRALGPQVKPSLNWLQDGDDKTTNEGGGDSGMALDDEFSLDLTKKKKKKKKVERLEDLDNDDKDDGNFLCFHYCSYYWVFDFIFLYMSKSADEGLRSGYEWFCCPFLLITCSQLIFSLILLRKLKEKVQDIFWYVVACKS